MNNSTHAMTLDDISGRIFHTIMLPHIDPMLKSEMRLWRETIDAHLAPRDVSVSDEDVDRALKACGTGRKNNVGVFVGNDFIAREVVRTIIQADRQRVGGEDVKLDAPARVGGVTFGKGVSWSTVIGCAQRAYDEKPTPPEMAEALRKTLDDIRASNATESEAILTLTQRARPGWKLVPVEPTLDMVKKAMPWLSQWQHMRRGTRESNMAEAYKAMLAAAPDAPTHDDAEGVSNG